MKSHPVGIGRRTTHWNAMATMKLQCLAWLSIARRSPRSTTPRFTSHACALSPKGRRKCSLEASRFATILRTRCLFPSICQRLRESSKPRRDGLAWWPASRWTWLSSENCWRKRRYFFVARVEAGTCLGPTDSQLLDAVERLVALLDSPQDIRPLAPLIMREITYRLLAGPQGARLRQIASAGAPAYRISKAILWLKSHFTESLSIEALAKRVGLSPSSLHQHFKSITAMSPLQYQKQLRLQEARRLLLGESLDAADAAYRVGYESPSQFSREYRRMFGAPPRKDVAALKVS